MRTSLDTDGKYKQSDLGRVWGDTSCFQKLETKQPECKEQHGKGGKTTGHCAKSAGSTCCYSRHSVTLPGRYKGDRVQPASDWGWGREGAKLDKNGSEEGVRQLGSQRMDG